MDKNTITDRRNGGHKHHRLLQTTRLLPEQTISEGEVLTFCVACLLAGSTKPAVGHTRHPEYRRVALCADCIAHYDRAVVE
jgi:hypothetical protein